MRHYHASALAADMPMARAIFPREGQARQYLLSLFARLPKERQQRLGRFLERRRFATWPPAYVLLVEECHCQSCLPPGERPGRP